MGQRKLSFESWLELATGIVQGWKDLEAEKYCCLRELITFLMLPHLWTQRTEPNFRGGTPHCAREKIRQMESRWDPRVRF